jgi:hypothetical protein
LNIISKVRYLSKLLLATKLQREPSLSEEEYVEYSHDAVSMYDLCREDRL